MRLLIRYGKHLAVLALCLAIGSAGWLWWTSESVVYSVLAHDQCLAQIRARNSGLFVDADVVFLNHEGQDVARHKLMRDEDAWIDIVTKVTAIRPTGRNLTIEFDHYHPVSVPIACYD